MNSNAIRRHARYWLAQCGSVGTVGLGLLLLTALAWFTLIRSGQKELALTGARLEALQRQSLTRNSLPVNSALDREEQLQRFYQGFPKAGTVPDALKRIYRASEKQHLMLETGEYAWNQSGTDRLARYRIALPVKGTFPQVLAFMDAVLQGNDQLGLENATFKRDKVDDPLVEAKLVFVVFVDTQP